MSQLINSNYFLNNDIKEIKSNNDNVIKELSEIVIFNKSINKTLEDLKKSGSSVDFAPVYQKINDIDHKLHASKEDEKKSIDKLNRNIYANTFAVDTLKKRIFSLTESCNFKNKIYFTCIYDELLKIAAEPKYKTNYLIRLPLSQINNDIDEILKLKNINLLVFGFGNILKYHYIIRNDNPHEKNHIYNKWFIDKEYNLGNFQDEPKTQDFNLNNDFRFTPYPKKFDIVFQKDAKKFYLDVLIYASSQGGKYNSDFSFTYPELILLSGV